MNAIQRLFFVATGLVVLASCGGSDETAATTIASTVASTTTTTTTVPPTTTEPISICDALAQIVETEDAFDSTRLFSFTDEDIANGDRDEFVAEYLSFIDQIDVAFAEAESVAPEELKANLADARSITDTTNQVLVEAVRNATTADELETAVDEAVEQISTSIDQDQAVSMLAVNTYSERECGYVTFD